MGRPTMSGVAVLGDASLGSFDAHRAAGSLEQLMVCDA